MAELKNAGRYLARLDKRSGAFDTFYYWFFSAQPAAIHARARCDVPFHLATRLKGKERAVANRLVAEALTEDRGSAYFYINAARAMENREAVPALKQLLDESGKPLPIGERKACLEALFVLTRNYRYWIQSKLARPRAWL